VRYTFAALLFALAGWGEDGHRIIAQAAWPHLAARLRHAFADDAAAFVRACNEPDARKHREPAEGARHYVDIERWSDEFLALARRARSKAELSRLYQLSWPPAADQIGRLYSGVPTRLQDYERWRGEVSDDDLGTIFYAVSERTGALQAALAAGDDAGVVRAAGDLCHYVGDLTQPLHNTANYRGQFSGNAICQHSVHERYESEMVRRFARELARRVGAELAHAPPPSSEGPAEPTGRAIAASRRAYSRLPALLAADREVLPDQTACERMRPADWAAGLYRALGQLTALELADAVRLLAELAAPRASPRPRPAPARGD